MIGRSYRALLLAVSIWAGVAGCSTLKPVRTQRQGLFADLGSKKHVPEALPFKRKEDRAPASLSKTGLRFRWPVSQVRVTSAFGKRRGGFHEGVDLRAPSGTPVYAAEAGTVLYADQRIRGYGRMVVLQHAGQIATVYAHNSKVLVRKGQKIKKGQKIAISGETGSARGPHVHFEVRHGVAAVDPLRVLN